MMDVSATSARRAAANIALSDSAGALCAIGGRGCAEHAYASIPKHSNRAVRMEGESLTTVPSGIFVFLIMDVVSDQKLSVEFLCNRT